MTRHPWSLNDAEFDALMALQHDELTLPRDDPVWPSLIEKQLVRLDFSHTPPALVLTPLGWRYPENS